MGGECRQALGCRNRRSALGFGGAHKPGELYRFEKGFFSDTPPVTFKTCRVCASIRDTLFCGFVWGRLWFDIRDRVIDGDGVPEDCIVQLTPVPKMLLLEFIQYVWDEFMGEEAE